MRCIRLSAHSDIGQIPSQDTEGSALVLILDCGVGDVDCWSLSGFVVVWRGWCAGV